LYDITGDSAKTSAGGDEYGEFKDHHFHISVPEKD
jgi:hypothetical protein